MCTKYHFIYTVGLGSIAKNDILVYLICKTTPQHLPRVHNISIYNYYELLVLLNIDITTYSHTSVIKMSKFNIAVFLIRSYGAPKVQEGGLWPSVMMILGPRWHKVKITRANIVNIADVGN